MTRNRILSPAVHRRREGFRLASVFGLRRRRDCPSRCLTLVETQHTANFFVDFQFMKVGRLLGPLHTPTYAADKIGFVNAIPCRGPNLDKEEPAKRGR